MDQVTPVGEQLQQGFQLQKPISLDKCNFRKKL
jgi:hypothetical protein